MAGYVANYTNTGTTGTSITVTTTGTTSGNMLVAALQVNNSGGAITTPTGWDLRQSNNGTNWSAAVFTRTATGSDNFAPSWTTSGASTAMVYELDASTYDVSSEDATKFDSTDTFESLDTTLTGIDDPAYVVSLLMFKSAASWPVYERTVPPANFRDHVSLFESSHGGMEVVSRINYSDSVGAFWYNTPGFGTEAYVVNLSFDTGASSSPVSFPAGFNPDPRSTRSDTVQRGFVDVNTQAEYYHRLLSKVERVKWYLTYTMLSRTDRNTLVSFLQTNKANELDITIDGDTYTGRVIDGWSENFDNEALHTIGFMFLAEVP